MNDFLKWYMEAKLRDTQISTREVRAARVKLVRAVNRSHIYELMSRGFTDDLIIEKLNIHPAMLRRLKGTN